MQDHARTWLRRQTSHWRDWPPERLLAAKRAAGTRISVVIPARNEERTVGRVVAALRQALVVDTPLVDEVIVVNSDSTDGTSRAAERAGAIVYRSRDIAPALGSHPGKGEALWKSLLVTHGDLLVFVDADLTRWGPHFVTGLLGPLLAGPPSPGQPGSGPPHPGQPNSGQPTRPAQSRPAQSRPAQSRPAQSRPAQSRPAQSRPAGAAGQGVLRAGTDRA